MKDNEIIHIKNMVCDRCILTVSNDLQTLDIPFNNIKLGEVQMIYPLDKGKKQALKEVLETQGFELLESRNSKLIESIKNIVRDWVQNPETRRNVNMSEMISSQLYHEYTSLSALFSSVEGITIEKYLILQKIEKAKELIIYKELSLSEISYQIGYSSVQHLSTQFKSVTGMNPTEYRRRDISDRKSLDRVVAHYNP